MPNENQGIKKRISESYFKSTLGANVAYWICVIVLDIDMPYYIVLGRGTRIMTTLLGWIWIALVILLFATIVFGLICFFLVQNKKWVIYGIFMTCVTILISILGFLNQYGPFQGE